MPPKFNFCNACGRPTRNSSPAPPGRSSAGRLRSRLIIVLAVVAVLFSSGICLVLASRALEPDGEDVPIHLRNEDEKKHMLELVNEARREAGAPPVGLGRNIAAQIHAEGALERCAVSH